MSWTDDDPGQGNPNGLLALAADLQADADDAASAARMLRSVQNNASDAVWKGTSADAFRDRIDKVPGHLDKLNASYADAAAGIRSYAASVRQIADDARVQQQIISNSTGDLHTAQAQQAAWTPPPHPATGTPDPAAKNPHDDQVAAANASIKKAQSQLHDLAGQRRTADGTLSSVLGRAHSEGLQNKHWWQKALDFVSEALSKITIVLMVVALVAIVVLAIVQPELIPGLLLLAGQVLTGLSAAQLAVDGARKASGENVSWGMLGMDALGLLPLGGGKLLAFADKVPMLARGAAMLSDAGDAVRGFTSAGKAFVGSFGRDLAATRYVVRMADTGVGQVFAGIEREGKGFTQMLSDTKSAAKSDGIARGRALVGSTPRNSTYAGEVYPVGEKYPSLAAKYPDGVRFTDDGFPDFKPYATHEVTLDHLGPTRMADFAAANKAAGLDKTPAGYTWHHVEDGHTMQLVPQDLHAAVGHTGGWSRYTNGLNGSN